MRTQINNNILDIDVGKTKAYYEKADAITQVCSCSGCINYEKAIDGFPKEVKIFFEGLGIDLKKTVEITPFCSQNNKKDVLYGGFYHICGSIISADEVWEHTGDNSFSMNVEAMYEITDGFKVGFVEKCSLLDKSFPMPAIQMEILFTCPWVLPIENIY